MASTSGQTRGSSADGTPASGGVYYVPAVAPMESAEAGGFQLQSLVKVLRRRRRTFLVVALAVTLTSGALALSKRMFQPVYAGGFTLLIADPINESGQAGGGGGGGDGSISSVARNVSRVDVPTLIRVLESPTVLRPVYGELGQRHPDRQLPGVRVSLVAADPSQRNPILAGGVLAVTAKGNDPELVRETLQLTEKAYLDWALEQRREKLRDGVEFLDEQAPLLRDRSSTLQGELERFRNSHNVLDPGVEAQSVRGEVEQLRSQRLAQQSERDMLLQVRRQVEQGRLVTRSFSSQPGSGAGSADGVRVDVPDQSLLEEFTRLEQQIAEAQAKYVAGTPMLDTLLATRERLRPVLQRKELEAVDAALLQLNSAIRASDQQIAALEGRFSGQPALLRQYEDLQQQLEMAEANLVSYQRTRDQFQLEIAQNNVPWKVIAPATVGSVPVEPSLNRSLLQALLLGLAAGAGAALLHEKFDHVFHSPGAVREELKQPLLGHIPHISFFENVRRQSRFILKDLDDQQSGLAGFQRFYYQEAFRNLYTSLRFLGSERPLRSVALTSSVANEGKSLAVVLLAKTLSELGQRVLLVDADMRKPQVHTRLGLDNLEGLSQLLTEDGSRWHQLVQAVPDHSGWDVLTAGRRPPDPPRLLSSARMGELVRMIADSGRYDLVIYDTPPVLGLADAALVAEHLDGIILLVSLGKVDRQLPAEAVGRIEASRAPLLGIVTNSRVAREGVETPYGGYGYGTGRYGGRYGYGTNDPYDPAVAYGYYTTSSDEAGARSNPWSRLLPTDSNRRRWRRALGNWLNG